MKRKDQPRANLFLRPATVVSGHWLNNVTLAARSETNYLFNCKHAAHRSSGFEEVLELSNYFRCKRKTDSRGHPKINAAEKTAQMA
jgi:hypothetical protein